MTRFLCTGDDQIGHGEPKYGRDPGEILNAQAASWQQRVKLAKELGCDAILYAGDAFERKQTTNDEEDAFIRPLAGLDIPVVAIVGNHDGNTPGRKTTLDNIADAGLLTLHRTPGVTMVGDTAVVCVPWMTVAYVVASLDGGDRDNVNEFAADLLVRAARGLLAQLRGGGHAGPTVLITHFDIMGDADGLWQFARAPVLSLRELEALGYDAVIAGHIHRPQLLSNGPLTVDAHGSHVVERACPVLFVGSPTCLNFGESDHDHGCYIVDVGAAGGRAFFMPLEHRRFVTVDIDTETTTADEIPDVAGKIVKLRITATAEQARRIDHAALRRLLTDAGAWKVMPIEVIPVREEQALAEPLDESLSDRDVFSGWLRSVGVNGDRGAGLCDLLDDYITELQR